jgi:hypothetical protein
MTDVPEGARLSDDGHWWWDEAGQQWQPVQGSAAATEAHASSDGDAASVDAGAAGGGDGDRAAARVAAGLPASLHEVTDDQRAQYLAEPQVAVEAVDHEEVEAVAMEDSGSGDSEVVA